VRTTQVGSKDPSATHQLDRFDSHSYAPSFTDAAGRTLDVFTIANVLPVNFHTDYFYALTFSNNTTIHKYAIKLIIYGRVVWCKTLTIPYVREINLVVY